MNTNNLIAVKFGRESLFVSSQQLFLSNAFFIRKELIIHKIFIEDAEYWLIPHFPFENYLYLIGPNALSLVKQEPENALDCLSLIYLLSRHETLAKKAEDSHTRQKNQAIIKKLKAWTKAKLNKHPLREEFTWLNKQISKHFPPLIAGFRFIPKFHVLHTDKDPPPEIWEKCADLLMVMWLEKNSAKTGEGNNSD
jgi:hypothetical protein